MEEIINELTEAEILSAFSQYPLCQIFIFENGCEPVQDKLEGIDFKTGQIIAERVNYPTSMIKMVLKPIEKMSDEDSLKIAIGYFGEQHKEKVAVYQGKGLAKSLLDETIEFSPNEYIQLTEIVRNLGYEIKPPFGKFHWAKNKSIFELGLAIEKENTD